ncbi:MAG: hypothetical protein DWQ34_26335 [Planctomycetota bacterium]|nr:MAG: hypothetical protein DWQ34_26335 [Planctomycetota bacterium]REJ96132.1 MAG: hypothetical protein DWQ29_01110 [Planctomycetota bacterium]REK22743.1 MAG: hypothetical protein DWQ41_18240 [Planctomycetota bacterium]REK33837.1 MAG: hypothetical protein DWQ45_14750 [Planctomycetota bacterium]
MLDFELMRLKRRICGPQADSLDEKISENRSLRALRFLLSPAPSKRSLTLPIRQFVRTRRIGRSRGQ